MDPNATLTPLPAPVDPFGFVLANGGRLLRLLQERGLEVHGAGWLQTSTDGRPYFYIVSPLVHLGRTREGYGLIQSVLKDTHADWIELMAIRLTAPNDPPGPELVRAWNKPGPPGRVQIVYGFFGGLPIEDRGIVFHAHPLPHPTPAAP